MKQVRAVSSNQVAHPAAWVFKCFLIVLLGFYPIRGQWHSFDLDALNPDAFNPAAVELFLRGAGLALGHHSLFSDTQADRLRFGISLSYPWYLEDSPAASNQNGPVPLIDIGYLVTSNLILTGRLSGFGSGEDVVQITSYGGILFLERADQSAPWTFNVNLALLQGPRDIYLRTVDVLMQRRFQLWPFSVNLGFGTNLYSGHATLDDDQTYAERFTGQTNYIFIGHQISGSPLDGLGIQLHLHPQVLKLSLDVVKEF